MFTLQATYNGYTGDQLWLSYSGDNYAILYDSSPVHMWHTDNGCLQAPSGNFPLAVNDKQLAEYGDRGSWRDYAFNMTGHPVVFTDDGQIALKDNLERRLCVHDGDDRRVHWSTTASDPDVHYLIFTKVPFEK